MQGRNRDTDVENEHVDTGPVGKGGMKWEVGGRFNGEWTYVCLPMADSC